MDSEQLSFLFGGSAKPKLAKEKVNVRKEKEKALAWAANEQKRYDLQVLKQDLTSQIQTTVNNIKKEQRYIVGEEQRQIRRLDKVDQFHSSLQLQKKQLEKKDVVAREFYEETEARFTEFDKAREAILVQEKSNLAEMERNLCQLEEQSEAEKQ